MSASSPDPRSEKPETGNSAHAYNRMLGRVKDFIEEAEEEFAPKIRYAIEAARDKASELGELTKEEAEKISDYVKKDIEDAASFLANEGEELKDWLNFDVELVEERLIDILGNVVDTTKIEFQQLNDRAATEAIWYSGEITSPGTLTCTACSHKLEMHETHEIPECPKCSGTRFQRRE